MTIDQGIRIAFSCIDHGVQSLADPLEQQLLPVIRYSRLNVELVQQGSHIKHSDRPAIPKLFTAVESAMQDIAINPAQTLQHAYRLQTDLIDRGADPSPDQLIEVVAWLQHIGLRDPFLARIPGINEPMAVTLFGATDEAPQWDRIDSAERLLRQLLTIAAPGHVAAPLTKLGHICWWKDKGAAAGNYMHVALTFEPDYRLARRSIRCSVPASFPAGPSTRTPPTGTGTNATRH